MTRPLVASLTLGLLAACVYGPSIAKFPPARSPEGVDVVAVGPHGPVTGELLEVGEAGLLLLEAPPTVTRRRVVRLRYGAIREVRFDKLGASYELKGGQLPTPAARERLQKLSRFPQGLTEALLRRLLDAYGQVEAETVLE